MTINDIAEQVIIGVALRVIFERKARPIEQRVMALQVLEVDSYG